MSSGQRQATVRDLVEEAKKRIVVLIICVVGLSYILSLTSSSVLMNLPAAASVIIILRYLSLDYDMRRKAATYNNKPPLANAQPEHRPVGNSKTVDKLGWRRKINSFVVEDAVDHFTRHLVSEWVTNLWYSRLTPDKEGPEELVLIINSVIGEFSSRMRNVNLISLLTRDLVTLICIHLDLFRSTQAKIQQKDIRSLSIERRDMELRVVLAAENKLHPALFSAEAEHKVLQHLVDGLMSSTFKHEDLQCSFFRITVRELLACAVIRPVLNLASPRFINERIEAAVISRSKVTGVTKDQEVADSGLNEPAIITSDQISGDLDPSVSGVELVQLKNDQTQTAAKMHETGTKKEAHLSKDPLLSIDTRSSRSWSSLPSNSPPDNEEGLRRYCSGGEWGEALDLISQRKTKTLAPEHFENMWTKGKNYVKKEGENRLNKQVPQSPSSGRSVVLTSKLKQDRMINVNPCTRSSVKSGCSKISSRESSEYHMDQSTLNCASDTSFLDESDDDMLQLDEDSNSGLSASEDEDNSDVTGLDSPGTKVWDGKSNRNLVATHIHHPLEVSEGQKSKKTGNHQNLLRNQSDRKKSRGNSQKLPAWQEVQRTSFISGDGQDILGSLKEHPNLEDSDDSDTDILGRIHSGATASSVSYMSMPESRDLTVNPVQSSLLVDSFFKLRCEVLGANIVRSGSKTFAVYSISVTDVNNNCWSIKRRYSHFEELHRRLKVFPEYKLHLPPKHFLSTGLEPLMIQERCELLDEYLKKLLQLPRVSGSIEVWDFLSVDSQTYTFSNSFSIIETLSVDLAGKQSEKNRKVPEHIDQTVDNLSSEKVHVMANKNLASQLKQNPRANGLGLNRKERIQSPVEVCEKDCANSVENFKGESDARMQESQLPTGNLEKYMKDKENDGLNDTSKLLLDAVADPPLPTEWVPPNLSMPILNLVDVVFQLRDGGWIRRKAFWVAKQILQLGMGDAFDDWLIEKIQLLRKGTVIAAGIRRIEEILWPDGIFITKHPKRQSQAAADSPQCSPHGQKPIDVSSPRMTDEQQQEAERRAKFVYELMIDKAPAAVVSLFGRKEYEQCAEDLYFFLQSSVCLKQFAFDLLELLLLSAFPELDPIFKKLQEEKHIFGEFKAN